MKQIRAFVTASYHRHIVGLHNADFEVCHNRRCRLARWLEIKFDLWKDYDEWQEIKNWSNKND